MPAFWRLRLEQAQEVLEDAKFLLDSNRGTLSAVNRCYYAMFYAVLALLQQAGKALRNGLAVDGAYPHARWMRQCAT